MSRAIALQMVVALGLAALALDGGVVAAVTGVAWLACVLAPLGRPLLRRVPWPLVTLPVLGGIAVGVAFEDLGAREALTVLLAYLQAHRRLGWRSVADDRVSVLLSGLMLVAAAGEAGDPLFLPLALLWAAAIGAALATVPLRPGPAVALGTAVLAVAVGVFTVVPRPPPGDLGGDAVQLTGIAPDVQLGTMDVLLDDPGVVFRATLTPTPEGTVVWRGIALDAFDGRRWVSTTEPVPTTLQSPQDYPPDTTAVTMLLEPNPDGMVFTAGHVLHVSVEGAPLRHDAQGGWYFDGGGRRTVTLMVQGPLAAAGHPAMPAEDGPLDRWRTLPVDLDPRVEELAARAAGTGDVLEQAQQLAAYVRDTYRYTREPRDAGTEDPLTTFLFERKSGHCEYFASALAVLARTRGIPARLVNGFVGGDVSPVDGRLVVRRYHAHSWVEVHVEGRGWIAIDATPGPGAPSEQASPLAGWREAVDAWWAERFVGYDRADQEELLWAAGSSVERALALPAAERWPWRGLALLVVAWLLVALVGRLGLRRLARRLAGEPGAGPRSPLARQFRRARRHVVDAGWPIPTCLPPVDAARWLSEHAPHEAEVAGALEELAWLYYDVELGGVAAGDRASRARVLADKVEALPQRDEAVNPGP